MASDLYGALVNLCQAHGFTTAATYEHLHDAVASIMDDDDLDDDHDPMCGKCVSGIDPWHDHAAAARNGRSQRRRWVPTRRGDLVVNAIFVLFAVIFTWILWTGFLV